MRPSSRRRVAAWLLALPLGRGGEECARRGRLEMISFWLLCWKLLRATAGLRRTTPELTDGNHDNSSFGNPINGSPTPPQSADPVTTEISSSSPMAEQETGNLDSCQHQDAEELHYTEVHGAQQPITDEQEEEEKGKRNGEEAETEHPLVETEGEEKQTREGGESEGPQESNIGEDEEEDGGRGEIGGEDGKRRETREEDEGKEKTGEEGEGKGKTGGEDEGKGKTGGIDEGKGKTGGGDEGKGKTGGEDEGKGKTGEIDEGKGKTGGEDEGKGKTGGIDEGKGKTGGGDERKGKTGGIDEGKGKTGGIDEGKGKTGEDEGKGETGGEDGEKGEREEEDVSGGETEGEKKDNGDHGASCSLSDLLLSSDSPLCCLRGQQQVVGSSPSELPAAPMLDERWGQDHSTRDDLSDSHLSDCLQAELAIVYSDSDAGDDQWAALAPCGVINQEEVGDGVRDGFCNGESKEEETKVEEGIGTDEQREEEEESREERGDDEEQMRPGRDVLLRSPSTSSSASSTDPDRKVPVDFCIHQEIHSENVSIEHVDFLLARQQWRKMEEVKGQRIPQPGLISQGSFHGTHTSLYPPTRSPRVKHREAHRQLPKEPQLSSTLSPSSEDSGLEDLSYRSPPEEPESTVEREIRLTLEREEKHRRERGMIAQSQVVPRPAVMQTGRSPPRPPACRTPTMSISPTPPGSSSLPRSVYHEMTANNVIILEPDSSNSASRNRLLSSAIGGLCDWPEGRDAVPSANVIVVETSNLIIRSASEFCLSSAPASMETQESTFSSNPFFKLRSLSSQSLVEQEIRVVKQREDEWRRQRDEVWRRRREEEWRRGRERYDTVLVSPSLNENVAYNMPEVQDRCVSSPSSPSRTRKMERSSLSCDLKYPPAHFSLPRQQNAMAQRWEASLLANQKKD